MMTARNRVTYFFFWLSLLAFIAACDSVQPDMSDQMVVEGFLDAGKPLPPIIVRRTIGLAASQEDVRESGVSDAGVTLNLNGEPIPYEATGAAGRYVASRMGVLVSAGDVFRLDVSWRGQTASAAGVVPPPVRLDSILLNVPQTPVEAVLVDSLRLDSLGIDAETGYLYAVEATMWWNSNVERVADEDYYIQTRLKPFSRFSSLVVDFFLLPEQVFKETEAAEESPGMRKWTGLYAVPVPAGDSPLPQHSLRLAAVRSGKDYADYALTRSSPERREPISNLEGGLGIVAGISVDSLVVTVDDAYAGKRTVVRNRN